jgi:hypothetical protein
LVFIKMLNASLWNIILTIFIILRRLFSLIWFVSRLWRIIYFNTYYLSKLLKIKLSKLILFLSLNVFIQIIPKIWTKRSCNIIRSSCKLVILYSQSKFFLSFALILRDHLISNLTELWY